jgi:hypothetical protein
MIMKPGRPECLSCRGAGRVQVITGGAVFSYKPCPKCFPETVPPSARPAAPAGPASLAPFRPVWNGGVRVDLGTTDQIPEGFTKFVDIVPNPNIPPSQMIVADLRQKWPFADSSVDYFRANDIIEHLPDKVFTMNEFYRCLRPGGMVEILVPTTHGVGFISDPQHCSFWSRASFDYFVVGTPEHNRFAKHYGISAKFAAASEERSSYPKWYPSGEETVHHLKIVLRALKENWKLIILSKNVSNLRRAVASVLATHPGLDPQRIIVVNDGAKDGWTDTDPKVFWVEGRKPFVYAANANIGILAAERFDIILMGDDCEVKNPNTFNFMDEMASRTDAGVVSSGITGPVGNPLQVWRADGTRIESSGELAFVCVCIPRAVLDVTGLLDEQFIGYGCEDVDLCWRIKEKGLKFLVDNRAKIEHNPPGLPSEWRSRPDQDQRWRENMVLLSAKWKRAYP